MSDAGQKTLPVGQVNSLIGVRLFLASEWWNWASKLEKTWASDWRTEIEEARRNETGKKTDKWSQKSGPNWTARPLGRLNFISLLHPPFWVYNYSSISSSPGNSSFGLTSSPTANLFASCVFELCRLWPSRFASFERLEWHPNGTQIIITIISLCSVAGLSWKQFAENGWKRRFAPMRDSRLYLCCFWGSEKWVFRFLFLSLFQSLSPISHVGGPSKAASILPPHLSPVNQFVIFAPLYIISAFCIASLGGDVKFQSMENAKCKANRVQENPLEIHHPLKGKQAIFRVAVALFIFLLQIPSWVEIWSARIVRLTLRLEADSRIIYPRGKWFSPINLEVTP